MGSDRTGAHGCDDIAVHEGEEFTGLCIKQDDRAVEGRLTLRIACNDLDAADLLSVDLYDRWHDIAENIAFHVHVRLRRQEHVFFMADRIICPCIPLFRFNVQILDIGKSNGFHD